MTTPEPPDGPTPPSFEKPAPGGSSYGQAPPPYGQPPSGGPYYNPDPYGTNPYGPSTAGPGPVAEMPPLGGLGHRLLARIIDTVLLAVVGVPLTLLLLTGHTHSSGRAAAAEVTLVLLGFVYEGLMLTLSHGQTLGKKAMRIRVAVLANGSAPTGSTGWIRSAVYWLPGLLSFLCIPALFSLLNILWCTWDRPYRQCLHDKAAKTVVVKAV
ncbi:RDD family protein [Streptacidiphilus sp. PB12-B1b]|uniref:RDD family protein n=1 Tax=Streptacidiphilus sp. PB12-B1b TaxID=2705012 RepID=UPI0015FA14F4|nr:RDD family protein [Streptacidiphilus sp. PB12-B1b]QMU75358.1 RDD family protein [Streptacidiphilus sp. PB12-B1b]